MMRLAIFFIFILGIFSCSIKSQNNLTSEGIKTEQVTTIYLVRHAEKEKDGTRDPMLNEVGKERAKQLVQILNAADIRKIYSTDYRRTKMTGQPLAKELEEEIEIYGTEDEIFAILEEVNSNVLVVGHSNTIPRLINRLIGKAVLADLQENEYDKLFVIEKKNGGYQLHTQSF